jgi:hypothetical protein
MTDVAADMTDNRVEEYNTYSSDFLHNISVKISQMSKFNHIEMLKIILSRDKNRELINDNKSGIHLNLTILDNDTIDEIVKYVKYISIQEFDLCSVEHQKQAFKDEYFSQG